MARNGTFAGGRLIAILGLSAALALLTSCTTPAPDRSPAQAQADQALASSVYTALNADPTYFFRHVNVRVDHSTAYLSGYVWSTDAIYRARQIARGVPGVRRVVTNHLELEREGLGRGPAR